TGAARKNFGEYLELLAIPNIPDKPDDMRRNAAFLVAAFEKRHFSTRLLDDPAGRPLVLAQSDAAAPGVKTILFYIHFDGQPVIPEEWAQKSPFQPVVKKREADGRWREVDREQLLAEPLDPELRVFARSAADDKAPIFMFLTAMDVLAAQGKAPAVRVKVILDSEEEISSPSLAGVIAANRPLFDDDEPAIRKRIGIASAEKVGGNYQEALQYPSLNVRGMAAGAVGAKAANIIPSEAVAELDLRTTPETDGRRLFELIRRHVEAQGYHLVDGAPLEEDRARYVKLASLKLGPVQ